MDLEHEKRLTGVEERAKSNTHRLDKLEPIVDEIHNMSETLVELTSEMKHTNENVDEIKNKVESIEKEPADKWKNSANALINALLGAVGTAIAAGLIYVMSMVR